MKTVVVKGIKFELTLKLTPDTTIGAVKQLLLDHLTQSRPVIDTSFILRCLGKELDESTKLGDFKNDKLLIFAKEGSPPVHTQRASPKKRKLCISDCGFYGDFLTNDMCSVCYKKTLQPIDTTSIDDESMNCSTSSIRDSDSEDDDSDIRVEATDSDIRVEATDSDIRVKATDSDKCHVCKKRIGLLGFTCKCSGRYCALHRSSFDHQCTYDHAKEAKRLLEIQNQKVENYKVAKL